MTEPVSNFVAMKFQQQQLDVVISYKPNKLQRNHLLLHETVTE